MKSKFEEPDNRSENTFRLFQDDMEHLGPEWHYHPEIELHYVVHGHGLKFIADHVSHFDAEEMILIGSYLPHQWRADKQQFIHQSAEALVLHFHPEAFGKEFLHLPETADLLKVFSTAKNKGLLIKGETHHKIKTLLLQLKEVNQLKRIILMMEIFEILSNSSDLSPLLNEQSFIKNNNIDEERIRKVVNYSISKFKDTIYIDDVANIANLSTTSFCRYFKQITKKSYFDFLTELRLNHACKLLINSNYSIKKIVEESGFENSSNFYRHFKILKKCTPKEYMQRFN